jgi:hypothetical protein
MNPYDLNKIGGIRGKYSNHTSVYDLNELGGFEKRRYKFKGNKLERKIKNGR